MHPALDRIEREGESVKLEPRATRLLLALAARPGEVVMTDQLLATVWKDVVVTSSSVYEVVAQLRRALGDASDGPRYIETVPRKGYRLVAPVSTTGPPGADSTSGGPPAQAPLPPARIRRGWQWLTVVFALAAAAALTWRTLTPDRETPASPPAGVTAGPATGSEQGHVGSILWVDDKPANNVREREALASFRLAIELATSTEEALARLADAPVDVVVSDMSRPGDDRAGYTLLESLRARGDKTPFVLYTSSCTDAQMLDARSRGALGCATRISEIMQTVLAALEART